jgi:hypothetical protein
VLEPRVIAGAGSLVELLERTMEHLLDERARQLVELVPLVVVERVDQPAAAVELELPDRLGVARDLTDPRAQLNLRAPGRPPDGGRRR